VVDSDPEGSQIMTDWTLSRTKSNQQARGKDQKATTKQATAASSGRENSNRKQRTTQEGDTTTTCEVRQGVHSQVVEVVRRVGKTTSSLVMTSRKLGRVEAVESCELLEKKEKKNIGEQATIKYVRHLENKLRPPPLRMFYGTLTFACEP
jgi:hypothetical protein